jgi:hypothetical protein
LGGENSLHRHQQEAEEDGKNLFHATSIGVTPGFVKLKV